MSKNINIFMLGFLVNSVIWRVDAGQMSDIQYPLILFALCIVMIIIQHLKEREG